MTSDGDTLFKTGGDMATRMAAKEWAQTPLGVPSSWPQSLRAIVRVMLTFRFAMWMAWGPDLTFFCNDAYLPTVGLKRDWVIGSRSDKVWAEIWADIGQQRGSSSPSGYGRAPVHAPRPVRSPPPSCAPRRRRGNRRAPCRRRG